MAAAGQHATIRTEGDGADPACVAVERMDSMFHSDGPYAYRNVRYEHLEALQVIENTVGVSYASFQAPEDE